MKRCDHCDKLVKNCWKHFGGLEKREVLSEKTDNSKKEISAEYSFKTEEKDEITDDIDWNKTVNLIKYDIHLLIENILWYDISAHNITISTIFSISNQQISASGSYMNQLSKIVNEF